MDTIMNLSEIKGKQTIESISDKLSISRQSAINLVSKLKKRRLVTKTGGGSQKRIYQISLIPQIKTNGFYDVVNKYSPIKLNPAFKHVIYGQYSIEQAIVDGINIGDSRTIEATSYLFKHITNWKRLFDLAKKHNKTKEVQKIYEKARKNFKSRRMPKRYEQKPNPK